MSRQRPVIVVGSSARYLAQSAKRSGLVVCAVDAFGDEDTRAAAVNYGLASGYAAGDLAHAVVTLLNRFATQPSAVVYGAGFEVAPKELARLGSEFPISGNRSAVLRWLCQPKRFFGLLDQLQIPYPEITTTSPKPINKWLRKNATGFGGERVGWARRARSVHKSSYFQQYVPGSAYSVTFAADGRSARLLGFNELMTVSPLAGDFRYAGAVSNAILTSGQMTKVGDYVDRLTTALKLRGVNGLDFVLDQDEPRVLELNARPTATLELYETKLCDGGLVSHLQACRGEMPRIISSDAIHATAVLYSTKNMTIGAVDWPQWSTDRPGAGSRIKVSEPLCSVHVETHHRASVSELLHRRCEDIRVRINNSVQDAA